MNRTFGATRNPENRMTDRGYAMAIGDTQSEISEVAKQVVSLESKIADHQANIQNMWIEWNNCKNSDCKAHHTKGRCKSCRDKAVGENNSKVESEKQAMVPLRSQLAQKRLRLTELRDILASETTAIQTLASQGLTPDAVVTQALGDAQAKINAEDQKAKTKKIVIISVAFAVVILGSIYVYKMIKAKKMKKAKAK